RLLGERGDTAVLLGAPGDVPLVEEVSRATRAPSLAGRDRPELLLALLAELDALASGDTGVAHLAAALGTPVVALFGPTNPRLTAPRGPVAVIRGDAPCAPCFYRTCPIDHPCMRAIEATAVIERLDAVLAEPACRDPSRGDPHRPRPSLARPLARAGRASDPRGSPASARRADVPQPPRRETRPARGRALPAHRRGLRGLAPDRGTLSRGRHPAGPRPLDPGL